MLSYTQKFLERLPVISRQYLSQYELSQSIQASAAFATHMDRIMDRMVLELRAHVLAEKIDTHVVTVKHPRSPWQARKLEVQQRDKLTNITQLLIAGWTSLFPVKLGAPVEQHNFTVWNTYPEAEIVPPLNGPVVVTTYDGPTYYEEAA